MIVLAVICLGFGSLSAQQNSKVNQDSTQALGLHFGNVSGNGLSYRRFFEHWGVQGVIGGYSTGNNAYDFPDFVDKEPDLDKIVRKDMGRKYDLNLGLNAIYPLKKTDLFTFYVVGGFCWKYSNRKYYKQDYTPSLTDTLHYFPDGEVYSTRTIKSFLNMGAGPGMEIKLGDYFKLALEIPITYTGKHEFIMYVPQVGIYYYFK
jgi:hypothetical protein